MQFFFATCQPINAEGLVSEYSADGSVADEANKRFILFLLNKV